MTSSGDMITDTIYVALLDEGTDVWRPVKAARVGPNEWIIIRPSGGVPDCDTWEFVPGDVVRCEQWRDGKLIATERRAVYDL